MVRAETTFRKERLAFTCLRWCFPPLRICIPGYHLSLCYQQSQPRWRIGLLKQHIYHPGNLHGKERCLEGRRVPQTRTYGIASLAWAAHPSRRALSVLSPWLPSLATWLFSCPCYCNPADGHLFCSQGGPGPGETTQLPWIVQSGQLHRCSLIACDGWAIVLKPPVISSSLWLKNLG